MIAVRINGLESNISFDGINKVVDLIELVKTVIDPDHMITSIEVDGQPICDDIWNSTLSFVNKAYFDFFTTSPIVYLEEQLSKAPKAVSACYSQFRDARKTFQSGQTFEANQKLLQATDTLKAFFDWYSVLMQLADQNGNRDISLEPNLTEILNTCKNICQLQLYKSWWALGESICNDLEPQLDRLEDKCRSIVSRSCGANNVNMVAMS